MKFFASLVVFALVAVCACEESVRKLEPVKEPVAAQESNEAQVRGKRGFVYSAPLTAAVEVPAPVAYTAAYTAPVAYSAALPYAYQPYANYYTYPAVYV